MTPADRLRSLRTEALARLIDPWQCSGPGLSRPAKSGTTPNGSHRGGPPGDPADAPAWPDAPTEEVAR
jgi:hypothetical protein